MTKQTMLNITDYVYPAFRTHKFNEYLKEDAQRYVVTENVRHALITKDKIILSGLDAKKLTHIDTLKNTPETLLLLDKHFKFIKKEESKQ